MEKELKYRLALTGITDIGPVYTRYLIGLFGNAETVFHTPASTLAKVSGMKAAHLDQITNFRDFSQQEKEIAFLEKNSIRPLFFDDPDYPRRLQNDPSYPAFLFYKGNTDLNAQKIVSVIGTRTPTTYGRQVTEDFIRQLAVEFPPEHNTGHPSRHPSDASSPDLIVVSGLAYGIDTLAHTTALNNGLATVAVLGHGLHTLYPPQNYPLSKQIVQSGGLLTQFDSRTKPDRFNFPARNRLVAGISDAVVIMESGSKGGSLSTAAEALKARKPLFAFPGRSTDTLSAGCNELIRTGKAGLLTGAKQLLEALGWQNPKNQSVPVQPDLFTPFTENERTILRIIKTEQTARIDDIRHLSGLNHAILNSVILGLELQGLIRALPGKSYRLA